VVIKNGSILPTAKPIFLKHATTQKISKPKAEKEKKTLKNQEPKDPNKPKRKYTRKVKPENTETKEPKRKYTRKVKPEKIEGKVEEISQSKKKEGRIFIQTERLLRFGIICLEMRLL
jgi:hypothetical protein